MKKTIKLSKKLRTTSIAIAMGAGAAMIGYSFHSHMQFDPSGQERQLQLNKVTFADDSNLTGKQDSEKPDESALWEKDEAASDRRGLDGDDTPSYLFEEQQVNLTLDNIVTSFDGTQTGANVLPGIGSADLVYDFTGDAGNADIIISGNDRLPNTIISDKTSGTTNGGSVGENGTAAGGSGSNGSNGNNGNTSGGGTTDEPSNGGNTPSPGGSTLKDPAVGKKDPSLINGGVGIKPSLYEEKTVNNLINKNASYSVIMNETNGNALYQGRSVDETTLLYYIDAYVKVEDTIYYWDESAYDKYLRIKEVSFDEGKTWVRTLPAVIPENTDSICVRMEYRLKTSDSWTSYVDPYKKTEWVTIQNVSEGGVYILNRQLEEDQEEITNDMLVDPEQTIFPTKEIDLLKWQGTLMSQFTGNLTKMATGWMENKKPLPWDYKVTWGQHVIEPMDMVDVPDGYSVQMKYYWMKKDHTVDTSNAMTGVTLTYLQTLRGIDESVIEEEENGSRGAKSSCLEIPEYIQAVDLDGTSELGSKITVDQLKLPSTLLYYAQNEENALHVKEAYIVDEDNPYLKSKNGILMDQKETLISAVPTQTEELYVPDTVTDILLSKDNQLRSITFEAENADDIASLDYSRLSDCKLVVQQSALADFVVQNKKNLVDNDCSIALTEDPEEEMTMEGSALIREDGQLYALYDDKSTMYACPENVSSIGKDAFKNADKIETLIIQKGQEVTFDRDCFSGSHIKRVICPSEDQVKKIKDEIGQSQISVQMYEISKEGYGFYVGKSDEGECIYLLSAPRDIREFDGTITGQDGRKRQIDVVGSQVFAGADALQWVSLPETTEEIGYRAFYGCDNLQGILIQNKEHITIGDEAFDACSNLRFVASNAMDATLKDGYVPMIQDAALRQVYPTGDYSYFYVPVDSTGYEYCPRTTMADEMRIVAQNADGSGKILYGYDENEDGFYVPKIVLRSEKILPEQVVLPETIVEIAPLAFSNTSCETADTYSINWDLLKSMDAIDIGGFYEAKLGGKVTLTNQEEDWLILGDYAFAHCDTVEEIEMESTIYGMGQAVFHYCSRLQRVDFGDFDPINGELPANSFQGCEQLNTIAFNSLEPPRLLLGGYGFQYQFNLDWTRQEEMEHLHLLVNRATDKEYLRQWRYLFMGYTSMGDSTAYQLLWNDVQFDLLFSSEDFSWPEDSAVDAEVKSRVLDNENYMRFLLHMQTVTEPTDFYPYRVDALGMIYLVSAPSYIEHLELDAETLDLPEGWYLDYIGTNALAGCPNLKEIIIPENLAGLQPDFLKGACANTGSVTLSFSGDTAPELYIETIGKPYTFGLEDARIHLDVPKDYQPFYLMDWTLQMCGYKTSDQMREAVRQELQTAEPDMEITDDMVQTEMLARLLPQENRLRAMMGMDQESEADQLNSISWILTVM